MPRVKKQHLKRRKDGRYCCRYKDKQFMGNTEEEALEARKAYILQEGTHTKQIPSVGEYALKWLKITKHGLKDKTFAYCSLVLNKLTDAYGSEAITDITPLQIKALYADAFDGKSDSLIKHARGYYKSLFDSAMEEGLISSNPARSKTATPHKGTYIGHRAITGQERVWIETLCPDHKAYPYAMVMLYAGLRPQEAKALDVTRDVDFENNVIHVQEFAHVTSDNRYFTDNNGKTVKATRTVPLFSPLKTVLKKIKGPLVQMDKSTVSAWVNLWYTFAYAIEKSVNGHTKQYHQGEWISFTVKPYDLRHTFITWCRDNGVELHTCIDWAGHSDSKMILSIYDEVTDSRAKKEVEKLEKSLFGMQNGMQTQDVSRETQSE